MQLHFFLLLQALDDHLGFSPKRLHMSLNNQWEILVCGDLFSLRRVSLQTVQVVQSIFNFFTKIDTLFQPLKCVWKLVHILVAVVLVQWFICAYPERRPWKSFDMILDTITNNTCKMLINGWYKKSILWKRFKIDYTAEVATRYAAFRNTALWYSNLIKPH